MERKQFTFYISYFRAISRIPDKAIRAEAYDAVCRYALLEEEPDLEATDGTVAMAFELMRPTLDAARKKAFAGHLGGSQNKQIESKMEANGKQNESKTEANRKQTGSKKEKENEEENEIEKENKNEIENESYPPHSPPGAENGFTDFWNIYPKKVGKQAAQKAFSRVKEPLPVLLDAIREQSQSIQWTRENGRFIPNPAAWLNNRGWEDQLPMPTGGAVTGATGLGPSEIAQLRQMMKKQEYKPEEPKWVFGVEI